MRIFLIGRWNSPGGLIDVQLIPRGVVRRAGDQKCQEVQILAERTQQRTDPWADGTLIAILSECLSMSMSLDVVLMESFEAVAVPGEAVQ